MVNPSGFGNSFGWPAPIGNNSRREGGPYTTESTIRPSGENSSACPSPVAAFLPSGKEVAFLGSQGTAATKGFIQDIADGKRRAFAPEGVNTSSFAALPITPDGTAAWLLGPDGQSYLYPVAGGDPKPLRGVQSNENLVRWSAEGRELFVSSPTGTPQRIYRIDLATGVRTVWKEVTPLQPAGVRLSQITVTPDGRALLHSYAQLLTNLYVVTGLASSPRR